MKFFHDEGVVLRKHPVGEKDEVLILLTKTKGKLPFMVYGCRDPKSRKAGALELFNTVAFEAREPVSKKSENKSRMATLQQAKLIKSRGFAVVGMGDSLEAFYRASEVLKMTDFFLQEMQFVQNAYEDLNSALDVVESPSIELIYKIRLLTDLGYVPEWDSCCICHSKMDLEEMIVFSAEENGFAHKDCCLSASMSKPVDKNPVKIMSYFQRQGVVNASKVELTDEQRQQVTDVLELLTIDH